MQNSAVTGFGMISVGDYRVKTGNMVSKMQVS